MARRGDDLAAGKPHHRRLPRPAGQGHRPTSGPQPRTSPLTVLVPEVATLQHQQGGPHAPARHLESRRPDAKGETLDRFDALAGKVRDEISGNDVVAHRGESRSTPVCWASRAHASNTRLMKDCSSARID